MGKGFETAKINEAIVDMIEDYILVCGSDGQIVFSNRTVQLYLGYAKQELNEKSFFDIVSDIYVNKAEEFFSSASEEPSAWTEFLLQGKQEVLKLHFKILRKDGLIYIRGNEKYAEYERLQKRLDTEIANAIKIHNRSLPESLPDTGNISFKSLYIPAEEMGGDLFDAFKVDNGLLNDYFEHYVCFIADVSGHGLDSAMLAIFVKDTIRSFFTLKHVPGQLLSPKDIMHFFVEQYLKEGYPEEYLVCLFIAVFDFKTKELSYCNAGLHICPLLVKDKNNVIELKNAGLPVSSAIDVDLLRYEDSSLPLLQDMTMFIMSDGLPEQRSNNVFYEDRMKRLFTEACYMSSSDIIDRVYKDFTDFLGYEKIKDDITLIVVKLLPD
ncbi:sigma-B regulation protein RsbU (phosphoserine phosphatase) [Ruminiclostridium sufflavum DSM 19573]|uniref:Sigma-B regulation protein RsbU (Phosphoserine phosphatase) n=1 Tax=Ruminiclostridium sufflavum DSM 19573 TaxID=1121337 RepID=A0A318XTV7_9FIRM|nr:SpoIIE family protein phosphatase [Ruminiclostridium sufflavum]PYG90283.1 sigma-B regulation protein RsbU (phosphoserine phosphatase) [Ruminiclostridium sufflavum DSM 19573]